MNFRRVHHRLEEPEINLIPLIDVLLVILIFLMVSTTFGKQGNVRINLPTANANTNQSGSPKQVNIYLNEQGHIKIADQMMREASVSDIAAAIKKDVANNKNPLIIIHADKKATHQRVIDIMQAASDAGFNRLSFATQITDAR